MFATSRWYDISALEFTLFFNEINSIKFLSFFNNPLENYQKFEKKKKGL